MKKLQAIFFALLLVTGVGVNGQGNAPLNSPCQNLDFPEGRNLGEFGRTLSEREDLIGECS